jgi:hypothetical protein
MKLTAYNWIPGLFMAQLVIVCLPNIVWMCTEGGMLRRLIKDLDKIVSDGFNKKDREADSDMMADFLVDRFRNRFSSSYVITYLLCELSGFMGTIVQMYGIDWLTDFKISGEGFRVFGHAVTALAQRDDELADLFPVVVKCNFSWFGPSGDITHKDAVCVLPLNLMVERYYVLIW